MNDDDRLFPTRDELLLCFPEWFVDWVLGPLPQEAGMLPFLLKQLAVSAVGWKILDLFLSPAAADMLARGFLVSGIASLVVLFFLR